MSFDVPSFPPHLPSSIHDWPFSNAKESMSRSLQDRDIFRCRPPLRLRSHQGETGGEEEEEEGGRELESRSDPRSSRETTSRSKGAILVGSERVKVFLRCCEVSRASRVDVVDGREEERGRRSRESSTVWICLRTNFRSSHELSP